MTTTLILITNSFPFGKGEAFIEPEFHFLQKKFDKIIIISRNVLSTELRKGNYIFHRINPVSNLNEYLLLVPLILNHLSKITKYILKEVEFLQTQNKLALAPLQQAIHDLCKALITSYHIQKVLKYHKIKGNVLLYSYWLDSSALATTFVKNKKWNIKRVARAHGSDIYEEADPKKYLSFRNSLSENLDKIFVISQNGIDYLKTKVNPSYHAKFLLSRLGSFQRKPLRSKIYNSSLILVSCSFLVPVKRIDLLIESLSLIDKISIQWIHIGGGPLLYEMENLAHKLLSTKQNVQYQFLGTLQPCDVQKFYQDNAVYLFINVSSSEGIPVSMMEAQSFGIPIMATNVGGVDELVNEKNGKLIDKNFTAAEIASAMEEMLIMDKKDYLEMRVNSHITWKNCYNAEKNFFTFTQCLASFHENK